MIKTMTLNEAADYIRSKGMSINSATLGNGLEQGVYPFGVCIRMERSRVFQIFQVLLDKWIQERED